jgi:[ribosomal protein S5]-alanine N-acetyltransferase
MIETARLRLRPFTLDDLEDYYRLGTVAEVFRFRGLGDPFPDIESARRTLVDAPLRDYAVHGFGRLACIEKATGAFVGFSGLKFLEDMDEVDIGYRFFPEHWGKGFATESSRAAMEHGRREHGVNRIIGLVDPENLASARVLVKLGLVYEKKATLDDLPGELDLYASNR